MLRYICPAPGSRELAALLLFQIQLCVNPAPPQSQETAMPDAWYEVLSMLHLMAMVCLLQANALLLPRSYGDGYAPRVSEGTATVC
jgi:hypothetical protein